MEQDIEVPGQYDYENTKSIKFRIIITPHSFAANPNPGNAFPLTLKPEAKKLS